MDAKKVKLDQDPLVCPICLDLLQEPTTIRCGHSYCMGCIGRHWAAEEARARVRVRVMVTAYSCPQCRDESQSRPRLVKNVVLAALVEQLKQAEAPREGLCTKHQEERTLFCRSDSQWICPSCRASDHRGHDAVPVEQQLQALQGQLQAGRTDVQQRLQDKERVLKLLHQETKAINRAADWTARACRRKFAAAVRLARRRSLGVQQQIRSQQRSKVGRVQALRERLEKEIGELQRRDARIKQLQQMKDHGRFLTGCRALPALAESPTPAVSLRPRRFFLELKAAVGQLGEKLRQVLTFSWGGGYRTRVEVLLPPPPRTRAQFLRLFTEVRLDPRSARGNLRLSEGNRRATLGEEEMPDNGRPNGPQEGEQAGIGIGSELKTPGWGRPFVLSSEALPDRCYFEVEWRGRAVAVVVGYGDLGGAGGVAPGGGVAYWALRCSGDRLEFWHAGVQTALWAEPCRRVGVFLDRPTGALCFHRASGAMETLHRVRADFHRPLHAALIFEHAAGDAAEFVSADGAQTSLTRIPPDSPEQEGA